MSISDHDFMKRCYGLAESAKAAGESPVGTVVVRDGEVIAEGIESVHAGPDPSGHAEMLAIRSACLRFGSADLSDCVLYTNVEPCFMCGYAIRVTGIGRVVIAGSAGEIGAVDSNYAFLTDGSFERWGPPPEVVWLK